MAAFLQTLGQTGEQLGAAKLRQQMLNQQKAQLDFENRVKLRAQRLQELGIQSEIAARIAAEQERQAEIKSLDEYRRLSLLMRAQQQSLPEQLADAYSIMGNPKASPLDRQDASRRVAAIQEALRQTRPEKAGNMSTVQTVVGNDGKPHRYRYNFNPDGTVRSKVDLGIAPQNANQTPELPDAAIDSAAQEVADGTVALTSVPTKDRGRLLSRMAALNLAPLNPKLTGMQQRAISSASLVLSLLQGETPVIQQLARQTHNSNSFLQMLDGRIASALYASGKAPTMDQARALVANLHGMVTITLANTVASGRMNQVMLEWLDQHTPSPHDTPQLMVDKLAYANWVAADALDRYAKQYHVFIGRDGSMHGVLHGAGYEGLQDIAQPGMQAAQRMGAPIPAGVATVSGPSDAVWAKSLADWKKSHK